MRRTRWLLGIGIIGVCVFGLWFMLFPISRDHRLEAQRKIAILMGKGDAAQAIYTRAIRSEKPEHVRAVQGMNQ